MSDQKDSELRMMVAILEKFSRDEDFLSREK
jgi:hypothetical protein